MQYLTIEPMFVFATGVAVALIVLLILEVYNNRRVSRLTYPVYEYALKRAEEEANAIVSKARAEARGLVEAAEAESIKLTTAHAKEDQAAEKAFQESLQSLTKELERRIAEQGASAVEAHKRMSAEMLESLKALSESAAKEQKTALQTLQKDAEARMQEQVGAVFAAAKKEADEYARARKDIVDSRIVDLVGDTVKIVMKKNLPADVHAQMVLAALEEAKANKVF